MFIIPILAGLCNLISGMIDGLWYSWASFILCEIIGVVMIIRALIRRKRG